MKTAHIYGNLSTCKRKKVGCIIVKENEKGIDNIIAIGYNGTPPGEDNCCEDENGMTKQNVLHAEHNALEKLNKYSDAKDAYVFITLSPCIECAKKLKEAGVKEVYFSEKYRCDDGLKYLEEHDIKVYHYPINENN